MQSAVSHDSDTGSGSNPLYTTAYSLDAQGRTLAIEAELQRQALG